MLRLAKAALTAIAVVLAASGAYGQSWPERPVKVVVGFPAGGNNDVVARVVAPRLSAAFGQQFIVENRPGASGITGTEFVVRSPADGYTLLLSSQPQIAVAPAIMKVPYDPARDLVPIVNVAANPFVFVVHAGLPVRTLAEFLDYARAHPKEVRYVATGIGSVNHMTTALLAKRAGAEMTPVFYKGGPTGLMDVIAGRVDAYLASLSFVVSHATTGDLRLLATTSSHRLPQLPEVPTFGEVGFPELQRESWNGLLAPAGTPRAVVDRIALETRRLLQEPELIKRLADIGFDPVGGTPDEFAATIADDIAFWREAVRVTGVTAEPEK